MSRRKLVAYLPVWAIMAAGAAYGITATTDILEFEAERREAYVHPYDTKRLTSEEATDAFRKAIENVTAVP